MLTDPDDLTLLQDPQQPDLGLEGELADLVEEEGAAMGLLEDAGPVLDGAGEGPLRVAEEPCIDQVAGDRPAVQGEEARLGPPAGLVDGPGEEAETYLARSKADAPEIDGLVYLNAEQALKAGDIISAKIEDADAYDLYGRAL